MIPAGRDEGKRFFTTVTGRAVINWAKNTLFTHVKSVPKNGAHVNGNVWKKILPVCFKDLGVTGQHDQRDYEQKFMRPIQHGLAQKRSNFQQDLKNDFIGRNANPIIECVVSVRLTIGDH